MGDQHTGSLGTAPNILEESCICRTNAVSTLGSSSSSWTFTKGGIPRGSMDPKGQDPQTVLVPQHQKSTEILSPLDSQRPGAELLPAVVAAEDPRIRAGLGGLLGKISPSRVNTLSHVPQELAKGSCSLARPQSLGCWQSRTARTTAMLTNSSRLTCDSHVYAQKLYLCILHMVASSCQKGCSINVPILSHKSGSCEKCAAGLFITSNIIKNCNEQFAQNQKSPDCAWNHLPIESRSQVAFEKKKLRRYPQQLP